MDNPLILYREDSDDSLCAAWILYSMHLNGYCEAMPVQRKDPLPNVQDRDVVLLDFSYERGILEMMNQQAQSLLVIAHDNEQDAPNLFGLDYAVFDQEKCAARLTWERFVEPSVNPPTNRLHYSTSQPRVEPPWLIDYIEDYALNRENLDACYVKAALASYKREFHIWDEIADRGPEKLVAEGESVFRMQGLQIEAALHSELVSFCTIEPYGHLVPCVCVNGGILVSEIAQGLVQISAYNIGVCYYCKPDGTVHHHVRACNRDIDCKRIADHYKGESTRFTADFVLDKPLPFTTWS